MTVGRRRAHGVETTLEAGDVPPGRMTLPRLTAIGGFA
jgi:hypothetical protein